MEWTKKRIAAAAVGGLFVIGVIGSATEEQPNSGGEAAPAPEVAAKPASQPVASSPAPQPALVLSIPDDRTVYRDRVTLTGRLSAGDGGNTKGARVEVNGRPARVQDGRWTKTLTVHAGGNEFEVTASKGGYEEDDGATTVTRKRSKAEIAQAAAARRAKQAARKQAYMAGAAFLPYNQLEKNPERHAGERVKYTGQIFQIQEDYGSSVILLSVTDEGYGFWTDNIWVDYDGTIKGAEDDIITVYGTIEGSKSYDTQIGGETYVPQMTAKYVVE